MKVIDDGVIKYDRSNFTQCPSLPLVEYSALELWRKKLFALNLIGEYKGGKVGFGNISGLQDYGQFHQTGMPQFIITGTQTGKYPDLDGRFYTRVLDYDIDHLKIKMMGPVEASSEALTHAAIYAHNKNIKAIFHIHSPEIWKGMIADHSDFTAKEIPYGTVEMARATEKCISNKDHGIFCMHGHEDGVVAYGRSLDEAGKLILEIYQKYFLKS
ncbi:MAG: class II aldolase/adducin family protein [Bacteriovorax sp.]|jgi:ribulose-5-phosphate 4-epimerase/fuculose-1-phosphate aldolase